MIKRLRRGGKMCATKVSTISAVTLVCLFVAIFVQCVNVVSGAGNVNSVIINRNSDLPYGNAYLQNKLITMKKLLTQNFLDKNKVALFSQVMPILRSMNRVQKLALSQMVANKVFSRDHSNERSIEKVRRLFGNDENITSTLMLPVTNDIANMFVTPQNEPIAAMLRSPILRNRNKVPYSGIEKGTIYARNHSCELFSNSICLKTYDYPIEDILVQLRRHKASLNGLLIDFNVNSIEDNNLDEKGVSTDNRRMGETSIDASLMCSSIVKYARPQKARATSGQWKYIVNTIEHTQTLRLERCRQADSSCAYLNDNFQSKCKQVYNYHRLLSWDKKNGLHMDIFKVPTCCSCHVESYKEQYPPLQNRPPPIDETFPGTDIGNGANQHQNQFQQHDHQQNQFQQQNHQQNQFQQNNHQQNQFQQHNHQQNQFQQDNNQQNQFQKHNHQQNQFQQHNNQDQNQFQQHNDLASTIHLTTGNPASDPEHENHQQHSSVFRNPLHSLEIPEINYQLEANSQGPIKVKHFTTKRPATLNKYLVPPSQNEPFSAYNYNQFTNNFVPRITSKVGFEEGTAEDGDAEANFENVQLTFNTKSKEKSATDKKKEPVQKINYVYHPIIDFFGSNMKEAILKTAEI